MEWLILVVQLIILAGFGALALFAKNYLPSYTKEKGKNLATKEDIEQITDKIESVKTEYARQLEDIKSQLNAKFHAHSLRLNKEFQCLQEVWSALLDLQCSAEKIFQPKQDERERREDHLSDLLEGIEQFHKKIKEYKPFYPENIYAILTVAALWQSFEVFNKEKQLQANGDESGISVKDGTSIMIEFGRLVNSVGEKLRSRIESY